ncbi:hypothetical protein SELMODRAFT_235009 [Selaginella moellendorffii]|uniref:Methyltransferase type 11 domain-containing protein n=3 Tax=Selaginella moellendorffii TaxID=88036 RepID=D8SSP1_SELML|nr:uncharacterized methyltransferase At2g41040, chloroplastic isoform X1 [Selaginella moellendorffii]EFJ12612.1 hypothetical protein SELMODRAFT_235009 [Selaginella moellendorffii]|eukprot:XP_002986403.1 uncharacterized methyltransferase At2g41040, chloroplastic isoform X1 [Selaginella moellendorffii]
MAIALSSVGAGAVRRCEDSHCGAHGIRSRNGARVSCAVGKVRFLALGAASIDQLEGGNSSAKADGGLGTKELLACPICFDALLRKGPPGINQFAIAKSGFQCSTCKRSFSSRNEYLDLTVTSGAKDYVEVPPTGTELFRNPLVSLIYERGWRQNFERSGFPGPDEELKMALEYLRPAFGGVIVDVSCGSGLFTRRLAKCGSFAAVIALDFSESMLRQCAEFVKQDKSLRTADIALVRADVIRLPFASGTVSAIHAGAALHCWPSPSSAVAEICRVLKPGGVFVATTFLSNSIFPFLPQRRSSSLRYWTEKELEELCKLCGLVDYQKKIKGNFIMLTARKQ